MAPKVYKQRRKHKESDLQQEANTLIDPRPTTSMKTVASNRSFVDVSFKVLRREATESPL